MTVIGGGPVGLWTAAELRLRGVDVTVVERLRERDPSSKGFTIHPRTLELWACRGLDDRIVKLGRPVPTGHFGLLDQRMDFSGLDTPFPYTLWLAQPEVERVLEEYARDLGVDIRRGHLFAALGHGDGTVLAHTVHRSGTTAFESEYLVGCDGTRSPVRQLAGIGFPGTDSALYTWVADVALDEPPERFPYSYVGPWGTLLVVPVRPGIYRVGGFGAHDEDDRDPRRGGTYTASELRMKVTAIIGTDLGLRDPVWISRSGDAARLADTYRKGPILLAGDAAHRHMPAGGVGLNVGLQDAWNLGWKLAAAVRGWAPDGLLDTYHRERWPVGAALVEATQASSVLMYSCSPSELALRAFLSTALAEVPEFSRYLAEFFSGLSVAYPADGDQDAHPLVGRRAPDLRFAGGTRLFALLDPGHHVLLDLTGGDSGEEARAALRERGPEPGLVVGTGLLAEDRVEWKDVSAALIRPDGHVAWASTETDRGALTAAATKAVETIHR